MNTLSQVVSLFPLGQSPEIIMHSAEEVLSNQFTHFTLGSDDQEEMMEPLSNKFTGFTLGSDDREEMIKKDKEHSTTVFGTHDEDNLLKEATERLEKGLMQYGCSHYRRRCRIRAPCCGEIFDCRHCHNEAMNSIDVEGKDRHDLPRHQLQQVICSLCGTEQEVRKVCISCGVCMGEYFCGDCNLFDDDTSKKQYHCRGCRICRIGGCENFFHCDKCRCCYSVVLQDGHPCIEGAMHHDCPVCFEYLFESTSDVSVLQCGHTMHVSCLKEMEKHLQYACPLCSKSVCDMSKAWERLDEEIAATPMPESYHDMKVWILCNDCGTKSHVQYHFVAQKCSHCKSYNTRQT